jgi:hypothetical protein
MTATIAPTVSLTFWDVIDAQLLEIATGADTFTKVKTALDNVHGYTDAVQSFEGHSDRDAHAQFYGSGGDKTLVAALITAGWHVTWAIASYRYEVTHPLTNDVLTYTEGDVDRGAHS